MDLVQRIVFRRTVVQFSFKDFYMQMSIGLVEFYVKYEMGY